MRTRILLLCVAWLVHAVCAVAVDYEGTFKGDQLTVTLAAVQGHYSGTIQMQGRKFPCTAREAGDQLKGAFESDGNKFEFTATLEGDMFKLQSGGTDYKLKRQADVVNPLARPASANPLAKSPKDASTRPKSGTNTAGVLRFKKVSVNDQPNMIGGEAFSFLAPVDWQVDGGLVWRAHPVMPAAVSMRVRNPKGLEQLETFPTVGFSWGGLLPVTGFPQGSIYLGNEVQPPVRDAIAFVKERLLPRARGNVSPRTIKTEALPKLAEAARQAEPAPMGGPQMVFTAGRVRIEYEVNGQPVEEDLYCVLNSIAMPNANMTLQVADKLSGLRATKGKLDEATKVFETMNHSTRINLDWFNKYSQLVQVLTQAQMNQIRAAGELSRYISRTSSEISDMMRASYEQRQASQDRINKNWSQYMRGVDEYRDPIAGRPVELPSGYQNAWANGNGEYIVTDSVNFNPNVELNGSWQKLERQE